MERLFLLTLLFAVSWVLGDKLVIRQDAHWEHGYRQEQVKALDALTLKALDDGEPDMQPTPAPTKPVTLYRPKTAKERAQAIATLWGLKDGNYEIGRLE